MSVLAHWPLLACSALLPGLLPHQRLRRPVAVCVQALAGALGGDASLYLLLGMLCKAKGKQEAAANAYAAAVRISLVSPVLRTCSCILGHTNAHLLPLLLACTATGPAGLPSIGPVSCVCQARLKHAQLCQDKHVLGALHDFLRPSMFQCS